MGLYTWGYEKFWGDNFQESVKAVSATGNQTFFKAMVYVHAACFTGITAIAAWTSTENYLTDDWINKAASVPELGIAGAVGAVAIDAFHQAYRIGRQYDDTENL